MLLINKYIGLTGAAYVAIPCVAPIALGGFYSFNGMSFYEYIGKKLHFMFHNRALPYVSTEGDLAIMAYEQSMNNTGKKKKSKKGTEVEVTDTTKNQEEFEAMKRKTKNILLGMVAVIIAAVAGVAIFKATR